MTIMTAEEPVPTFKEIWGARCAQPTAGGAKPVPGLHPRCEDEPPAEEAEPTLPNGVPGDANIGPGAANMLNGPVRRTNNNDYARLEPNGYGHIYIYIFIHIL